MSMSNTSKYDRKIIWLCSIIAKDWIALTKNVKLGWAKSLCNFFRQNVFGIRKRWKIELALCKYRQRGLKWRERNANLDKRHKGVYFEIEFTLFRFIFQGLLKSKIAKINIDLSLFAVCSIYRNEIKWFLFW